uniref:L-rhamnose mutarotase n=1 Tax=uncultured Sphingomonas sp. TaxID=158754 RepID=UPI0035C9E293
MSGPPAAATAPAAERHILLLDLRDEPAAIAAYDAWHAVGAVPAAVVAGIRARGIADMQIFRAGNRLVMLLEPGAGFDPQAKVGMDAATPEIEAWERLMDGFQQAIPGATPGAKWTAAHRIFALGEQLGEEPS